MNEHLAAVPPERRTIAHALADADPAAPFFRWAGRTTTVGEVREQSDAIAGALTARGISAGERVGHLMGTSPGLLALWFAIARAGAVEVPINTAYRGALLADQLRRARVRTILVDAALAGVVEEVREEAGLQEVVVVGAEAASDVLAALGGPAGAPPPALPAPEDLGCIIYTSGTTGPSKGVLISHGQELSFGAFWTSIVDLRPGDVVLNYLPFFHIAGKFLTTAALQRGATMVLRPRLSIDGFWDDARAEGITHVLAVGGVCNMLHGRRERPDDADNPVRVVYAVPAPAEIHERFEQRFGVDLVECYGSTEANLVLHTRLGEPVPGSCGKVNPDFEVRIADPSGAEVPVGESGEILVRPRHPLTMTAGYDGMPEKTEQAWAGGWFHTGDRARRDADGNHWFLDRLKDSVRRRGENISSFEVERAVGAHPDVAEVAVVGVPSELGEEDVLAAVVPRDGHRLDPEALLRFCADTMAYFMVPRYLRIVDELPRTPTSKVEKYRLREAGVAPGTWDCEAHGLRVTRRGLEAVPPTPA